MPNAPEKPSDKILYIGMREEASRQEAARTIETLLAVLRLPAVPVPQEEINLLGSVALGDTGQSRACRYLLFLLVGAKDPSGFTGDGLLELRTLDRNLADAFLKVLAWWRGPTKSDEPMYEVLRKIANRSGN